MRVIVAGATGFIGRALCLRLAEAGHEAVALSREEGLPPPGAARRAAWPSLASELEEAAAVVNLAGAGIADARWTRRRKAELRSSRVDLTRRLVSALSGARRRPRVLVNASAVGYYGDRGPEVLTEDSGAGTGFLAELCAAWEAEAARAREWGGRSVRLRFGVVLGRGGGALARMLPPFRLGLGGSLGSGRQHMSWIHVDDAAGLALHALAEASIEGPLNAVAPQPVTNAEFSRALARALRRPCLLAVPAFALRLAFGELAGEALLASQRAEPAKALATGYAFRHPTLAGALAACV